MDHTLRIMEIERFALHDGPGIRTVVFLQGCPLHCPWCANPESQAVQKQLLYRAAKCIRCRRCLDVCAQRTVLFRNDRPVFDRTVCGDCESCGTICPGEAIRFVGTVRSVADILREVTQDEAYYRDSGGGLTVSGGEPFVQYSGFRALLRAAKSQGLQVAVETAGHVPPEQFRETEPDIDLFLFDIKHVDAKRLRDVTGADLTTILTNLEYAADRKPRQVILRVPVIPGFNHDAPTLEAILEVAVRYGIGEVHLLPYHTLGSGKYEQLGKAYQLGHVSMLDPQVLLPYVERGAAKGLKVVVGG